MKKFERSLPCRIEHCVLVAATLALGSGCLTVGPDYKTPDNEIPASYKSGSKDENLGSWKESTPMDAVQRGKWWTIFGDEELNRLEEKAAESNQDLRAAIARMEQFRASARFQWNDFLPTLDSNPSWRREKFSPNQEPSFGSMTANTFRLPLDLSYEVDLWGRVRRAFESARGEAQASEAAAENMLLVVQTDLAQNYFALRALDAEARTLSEGIELRKEQLKWNKSRFEGGIGNRLDLSRAETELASAEVDHKAVLRRRAEIENAIGILVGEVPSSFKVASNADENWHPNPPKIPTGLPSALLERRPDVAEAERLLASANAKIGVAEGAFFPVIRLTGSGGFVSGDLDTLFNWESRVWSIGPSISLPIFSGTRSQDNLKRARGAYDEAVANYRKSVLVAFSDVENSLSGISFLAQQDDVISQTEPSVLKLVELTHQRFKSGIVNYFEVIDAERTALQFRRTQVQVAGQRMIAAVQLIKALGGDWSTPVKAEPEAKPEPKKPAQGEKGQEQDKGKEYSSPRSSFQNTKGRVSP